MQRHAMMRSNPVCRDMLKRYRLTKCITASSPDRRTLRRAGLANRPVGRALVNNARHDADDATRWVIGTPSRFLGEVSRNETETDATWRGVFGFSTTAYR